MAIVCGTDFSLASWPAVEAAACLAARSRETLHLVHVLDVARDERKAPHRGASMFAEQRLQKHAERLHRLTRNIQLHVSAGLFEDVLVRLSERLEARLLVLAPVDEQTASAGNADRISRRTHVPALVVRDAACFKAWERDDRPLHLLVAGDRLQALEDALRWAGDLTRSGPCALTAVHLYSPARELDRLGLHEGAAADAMIREDLERELGERCAGLPGTAALQVRAVPCNGERAANLLAEAHELHADIVVMAEGLGAKPAWPWSSPTIQQVLSEAPCSVACVPSSALRPARSVDHVRSVLVATDFSHLGNQAVALGHALLAPGGSLHLLHVLDAGHERRTTDDVLAPVSRERSRPAERARERLSMLRPGELASDDVHAELHVVESGDVAKAICQVAERLDVEVVCLGSQEQGRLRSLFAGSVSEAVLHASQRPVMFARPEPA